MVGEKVMLICLAVSCDWRTDGPYA